MNQAVAGSSLCCSSCRARSPWPAAPDWGAQGLALAYGSAQAELGMWVLPWMELVGYIGYGAMGNLMPGAPFSRALLRTPVIGLRIAWGSQQ